MVARLWPELSAKLPPSASILIAKGYHHSESAANLKTRSLPCLRARKSFMRGTKTCWRIIMAKNRLKLFETRQSFLGEAGRS